MTYTPGPWAFDDDEIVALCGTHVVCFGHDYDDYGGIGASAESVRDNKTGDYDSTARQSEIEANARLIAAAPELLAVVCAVAEFFKDTNAPLGAAARRAIAKAEGQ